MHVEVNTTAIQSRPLRPQVILTANGSEKRAEYMTMQHRREDIYWTIIRNYILVQFEYIKQYCFFFINFLTIFLFEYFLRLVYLMLSVSLDYPFLIAPSVFSNVYVAQHFDIRRCI